MTALSVLLGAGVGVGIVVSQAGATVRVCSGPDYRLTASSAGATGALVGAVNVFLRGASPCRLDTRLTFAVQQRVNGSWKTIRPMVGNPAKAHIRGLLKHGLAGATERSWAWWNYCEGPSPTPPNFGAGRFRFRVNAAGHVATTSVKPPACFSGGTGPGAIEAFQPSHRESARPATPSRRARSATRRVQAGAPVPAGFGPQSFTAISDRSWWLLGSVPCSRSRCPAIVRTTNGGHSFHRIPAPSAPLASSYYGAGVTDLRFADRKDGFAYGGGLYVTHDGGASWHRVSLGGWVTDLAIGGGEVYAVVVPRGRESGRLMRSPVDRDRWVSLASPSAVHAGLWVHGSDVFVETGFNTRLSLLSSPNRGASFVRHAAPDGISCAFQAPAPPVVWAHCATGMLSGVWRSTDSGARFQPAAPRKPQANGAAFAAASATTAVVGFQRLYRTVDGGASWAPVGPAGVSWWSYLGFTDPTHGVALGYLGPESPNYARLYSTTDGGASYHEVPIR